jgi:hypothetical protein
MLNDSDILMRVRSAASGKVLYLPHAVRQMLRPERMISTEEVRNVIFEGVVIENYPKDPRGHSCLMLGIGYKDRPIHIVCAPKQDYLAIITAYVPDPNEWQKDFKERIPK